MHQIKNREIIGRDKLLAKKIYPKLKKEEEFILIGQRGIGKTELLKWSYLHYEKRKKAYVSCNDTYGNMIKKIAKTQGITISKKKIADLQKEVLKGQEVTLFIDDLERLKPKQVTFFDAWGNWNKMYFAGVPGFREEAKKILWGKPKIKINKLGKMESMTLAKHVVKKLGCIKAPDKIATKSKGIPGRMWALGKGQIVRETDDRTKEEEVNIAPIMSLFVVAIMVTRYIALGVGERDLYILAGIGMGVGYLIRQIIRVIQ
ncbi:MAG: hypothetical protein ACQERZ_09655 [Fusobacteriota bacterium]